MMTALLPILALKTTPLSVDAEGVVDGVPGENPEGTSGNPSDGAPGEDFAEVLAELALPNRGKADVPVASASVEPLLENVVPVAQGPEAPDAKAALDEGPILGDVPQVPTEKASGAKGDFALPAEADTASATPPSQSVPPRSTAADGQPAQPVHSDRKGAGAPTVLASQYAQLGSGDQRISGQARAPAPESPVSKDRPEQLLVPAPPPAEGSKQTQPPTRLGNSEPTPTQTGKESVNVSATPQVRVERPAEPASKPEYRKAVATPLPREAEARPTAPAEAPAKPEHPALAADPTRAKHQSVPEGAPVQSQDRRQVSEVHTIEPARIATAKPAPSAIAMAQPEPPIDPEQAATPQRPISEGTPPPKLTAAKWTAPTPGPVQNPLQSANLLEETPPQGPAPSGDLLPPQVQAPTTAPQGDIATAPRVAQQAANQIAAAIPRDQGVIVTDQGAEIALDPPELGRVRMVVTETAGGLALTITAERQETLDLFRRHAQLLSQEFAREGLSDTSFDFRGDGDQSPSRNGGKPAAVDAETQPHAPNPPTAREGEGGLDLRL